MTRLPLTVDIDYAATEIFETKNHADELLAKRGLLHERIAAQVKACIRKLLQDAALHYELPEAGCHPDIHGETDAQTVVRMPDMEHIAFTIRTKLHFAGVVTSAVPITAAQAMHEHARTFAEIVAGKTLARMQKEFLHIDVRPVHIPGIRSGGAHASMTTRSDAEKN